MRVLLFIIGMSLSLAHYADTMNHYMNIADQIPQMEMRANAKAQAWARSARTVLDLTHESIVETIIQANELAKAEGKPLYCRSSKIELTGSVLGTLILQTYNAISSQKSDKEKMTVSQVAWLAVLQNYPCSAATNSPDTPTTSNDFSTHKSKSVAIEHMDTLLEASRLDV